MERNKNLLLFLGLLCGLVYLLGSCTGDNDLPGCDDLSIGMQIPMTRSADPESPGGDWKTSDEVRRRTPVYENECGLYALTEVAKRDRDAFTENKTDDTAEDYYNRMKTYAKSNYAYEGGAMPASTMLALGQRNGILTDMVFFNEPTSSEDYFRQKQNVESVRIVCFQKEGKDHYAKIDRIDIKKGEVVYTDSETNREEKSGRVSINQVEGVMYYDGK